MVDRPELTERQREVFDFIQDRIKAWGYPPTIREIGEHLGIRSTNGVADHLKALKRKGYLLQQDMKSRTLMLVNDESAVSAMPETSELTASRESRSNVIRALFPSGSSGRTVEIPILGRVAAGEPILAEEHAEGSVVVDQMMIGGNGKKVFALKVVGESMIEDGIYDGDYIFVRKKPNAEPGEIVVVLIENEATVKRYYPENDRIRLQPANATMKPIYVDKKDFKQIQIIGLVVGVYRRLPG
ncbi:MAG: transcriptional repressor LexA [Clostridia bacterium]|nr:transcriptional repressor LexA [Deltaproteobacteria bacterium]